MIVRTYPGKSIQPPSSGRCDDLAFDSFRSPDFASLDIACPPSRCRFTPETMLGGIMRYVCDAPGGKTWFRIETEAEAVAESETMRPAVEKNFRKEQDRAAQSLRPISKASFEQEIGP